MNLKINFNSIITRISAIFIITIILFSLTIIGYFNNQQNELQNNISQKYRKFAMHMKENRLRPHDIIEYTKDKNLIEVTKPDFVVQDMHLVAAGPGYEVMKENGIYYAHFHGPGFKLLFQDASKYKINYFGLIVLGATLVILILSFLWIISALRPLKELKEEIRKFSKGDLNIDCKSNRKDEIAEVGNEFDNAVKKISLLLNSRQLFLRTIMHELKTPIAKGRIVSELVDDEKQKNRMILIFDKLNYLINNFSRVEELVSQNYKIHKYSTKLDLIIETSLDMMLLDNPKNKVEVENISKRLLNVDLDLFSLAIKNLLDNGIKYSEDKKVRIEEKDDSLEIISKGEKLQKPLEDYFKAYHNETKSKNHGMGLGLYIVHEILKMHQMNLEYEYIDGNSIFKITF